MDFYCQITSTFYYCRFTAPAEFIAIACVYSLFFSVGRRTSVSPPPPRLVFERSLWCQGADEGSGPYWGHPLWVTLRTPPESRFLTGGGQGRRCHTRGNKGRGHARRPLLRPPFLQRYCQCLCLIARLFLDHKAMYFEVKARAPARPHPKAETI